MTGGFPRGRTAIVGTATFGEGSSPGYSAIDLAVAASVRALNQANLTPADVDGLFIGLPDDFLSGLSLAEYLGIRPRVADNNRTGGSAFQTHVQHAALALDAGECDVALIAYGSNQRSGAGKLIRSSKPPTYEGPYKPAMPVSAYALAASRHMHLYGTTRRDLAEVAVAARQWAAMNPAAFLRDSLTIGRRARRPDGVGPAQRTRLLPGDRRGGCGGDDTSRSGSRSLPPARLRARRRERDQPPRYLVHAGSDGDGRHGVGARAPTRRPDSGRPTLTCSNSMTRSRSTSSYSSRTLVSALRAKAAALCRGAGIAPGGSLPVNTNGGGLSYCHPGMYGLFTIVEAADQVMRRAGPRQIDGVSTALAHGSGGVLASQATIILGGEETL